MKCDYSHQKTKRIKLNRQDSDGKISAIFSYGWTRLYDCLYWTTKNRFVLLWRGTQIFIGNNGEEIGATITGWILISL